MWDRRSIKGPDKSRKEKRGNNEKKRRIKKQTQWP
jgi:hypothetical protein